VLVLGVGLGSYFMYAFFIFILYIRIERQGCVTFASGLRWRLAPKAGGYRVLSVTFASGLRQECVRGMQRLWLVFFPDLLEAIF
jgi:hypothetical protein